MTGSTPSEAPQTEIVFYDGNCGLCHRAVKFVLKHDSSGTAFRFAPLHGETFSAKIPARDAAGLRDSMVVLTAGGSILMRSDAWLHILRRLGGRWALAATAAALVPRSLRDGAYNAVAAARARVFGRTSSMCPVVPKEQRARFYP